MASVGCDGIVHFIAISRKSQSQSASYPVVT